MNKRGLSQVVTTILIILITLVAITTIWVVVNEFVLKGTSKIDLTQFTLDLGIKKAEINYTTGIAEVRVVRNAGEGNLTAIKFIVEDDKNSDIFEEKVTDFEQLAERTFELNLTESDILVLEKIRKISIVPVYISGTNVEMLGSVADSRGGLNDDLNITIKQGDTIQIYCEQASDCGTDSYIADTETCTSDLSAVLQYKKVYSCELGFCLADLIQDIVESCPSGWECYQGACVEAPPQCTNETVEQDCGTDGYIGLPTCAQNPERIVQDYAAYSCINETCSQSTTTDTLQECAVGEICNNAECFVPLECASNQDCWDNPDYGPGYVCTDGNCTLEVALTNGTIRSAWPFGVGEYFDSSDLPTDQINATVLVGKYIIFPGSLQAGCLTVKDLVIPTFEGGISYIRLNESKTNITDTDLFEIWETEYICTVV
jgi:hypothetical protein